MITECSLVKGQTLWLSLYLVKKELLTPACTTNIWYNRGEDLAVLWLSVGMDFLPEVNMDRQGGTLAGPSVRATRTIESTACPCWSQHGRVQQKGLLSCNTHWAKKIAGLYLHFLPFLSINWETESISALEWLVRMKDLKNENKKRKKFWSTLL